MPKRSLSLSTFGLLAAMALPATAQDANTVVATVNDVDITIGHMIVARATLPEQYQSLPDDVLFDGILEQLINQTLLEQSFEGDLPKRVTLSLENETRSLTAGEVLEDVMSEALTEEAVQALYDAQISEFEPNEEFNASHILVETEEDALAIIAEIAGGAEFAAVAREKSTGPSGPNGGNLGWFGVGAMVPSFEAAVVALEIGDVSAPVQTQFGWHVIILNEKRQTAVPELEAIRSELETGVREAAVASRIDALKEQANVERAELDGMDLAVLKDLSLVE